MKTRAEFLAWKRQHLIAECIAQRSELAMQLQPVVHTMEAVNTGLRIVDRVRQHPGWIAGTAVALLVITPHRISSALRLGTSVVRTWRSMAPTLKLMMARE